MATRMQQRRGTETQWTTANPVLAAGEIGFEIDTNQFKIGDGVNQWSVLEYFGAADDVLANLIGAAPETLNTLEELANAIGNNPEFAGSVLAHTNATTDVHGIANTLALLTIAHAAETANVHGIADTSLLATTTDVSTAQTAAKTYTDSEIIAHGSLTENVHGIANTLTLITEDYLSNAVGSGLIWDPENEQFNLDASIATQDYASNAVADHNNLTENVHGIANTLTLATLTDVETARSNAISVSGTAANTTVTDAISALTKSSVGLGDVDNTSDLDKPVSTATQTAIDLKASLSGAEFTGNVEVSGNLIVDGDLTINGNNFAVSATSVVIEDNILQLAHENEANTVDLGLVVAYNDGTAKHSGFVRDVSENKWKLFEGVETEPSTVVAFSEGTLDDLAMGALEVTTITPSSGVIFSDGTQTKEAVPSRTVIQQKTDSYTLSSLDERDDLIEISKATATTVTIPLDSTLNYPIGTSIDILRTGAGDVTIAGDAGVTVNGTPGLKLRATFSSATCFKRAADTWLVIGDLSA